MKGRQADLPTSVPSADGKPGRNAAGPGAGQERVARVAWIVAGMMALIFVGFAISVVVRVNLPGHGGESLQLDFTAF